ncbi:MAG: UbiA prenyltransferase family protein [Bryobacterales bacterium]|nr:UbiA prenyltransferase family protein [Bryobacterales bacterium]
MPSLAGHLKILRVSHWVKNVFVLPGVLVALALDRGRLTALLPLHVLWGLLAIGLVASSNYVLNEILDSDSDRAHPVKCHRPIPMGQVSVPLAWLQWIVCALCGMALGAALDWHLAGVLAVFWLMACVYNVRPLRAKDRPYLDVLLEGFNNPLRMLAGWYLTGSEALPVLSLLFSYWMAGCYFMAVKRLAEYRMIANPQRSAAYRKSFEWYTEPRLLVSILFYATCSMLFFGAFLMRYRMEMVLSFPLVAIVMAAYLHMGFEPDSAAQRPEKLYRDPLLMTAIAACGLVMGLLLFVDIPLLYRVFPPTSPRWP